MTQKGRPKGSKNKPKKQTYIALVIDRSGSMSGVRDAAFTGINEQLSTIRKNAKKGGNTFVTYIQFDDVIETIFDQTAAENLKDIVYSEYEPRGSTAMLDAVGTAIESFTTKVIETSDTAYLIIVVSDGYENASRKETYATLAEKIKKLEATDKWTFTYMLSNIDLSIITDKLGASAGNVSSFASTPTGTVNAFSTVSGSSVGYMTMRSSGVTSTPAFYSPSTPQQVNLDSSKVNVNLDSTKLNTTTGNTIHTIPPAKIITIPPIPLSSTNNDSST